MTDRRGFTLIEILISVAIVGLLASAAMPGVHGLVQMQQVRTEAQKMVSALRSVQQEAVSTELATAVTFNSSSSYSVQGKLKSLPDEISYTVVSPVGTGQITFSSLGVPSPSTAIVQFSDNEGRVIQVTVNPSGRISSATL